MSNTTSLYSTVPSGNATVPANNNTGLYNATGNPVPINNNISVTGNIVASGNALIGGYISAGGNITTSGYFIGDGSLLSNINPGNISGLYSNANVAAYLPIYSGNLAAGNAAVSGTITAAVISTTGNITGNYFFGNGSQLTGLPQSYSNANVAAFLPTYSGNLSANAIVATTVGTTGNISANYFLGNGALLTGLPATYSNANVAAYLPTYSGNLDSVNRITATGNIAAGNITTAGQISATGNITSASNVRVLGANGNIVGANYVSANFYLGDGGLLANINAGNLIGAYSNANVANYLPTYSGVITAASVSATGNITGNYFFGNGSQLTGLPQNYSNANVAAYLPTYTGNITATNISASGNITVSGNLFSDDLTSTNVTIYGDQVITGNLTVQGTTTTINSNTITTNDKTITVANNQSTAANVDGAGLEVGNAAVATWLYHGLTNTWQSNIGITPIANNAQELGNAALRWSTVYGNTANFTGNITGQYFIGNGSQLTGLPDTYTNANVADFLANSFGSNTITTTGNISAHYFVGGAEFLTNVPAANVTGTFGNVNTSGRVSATGNITGNFFIGDGSQLTNLPVQPGTYSNANVSSYLAAFGSNTITTTGNITAGNFIGNGSELTTITGANVTGTVASANTASQINVSNANSSSASSFYVTFASAPGNAVINIDDFGNGMSYTPSLGRLSLTAIDASGRVLANSVVSQTTVSATGNITGNFFIGNGSQLTGIVSSYGNANVATLLASFGSNTISTTGNVTVGYVIGDGSQLTNLPIQPGTYSNANVANYLPTYSGNIGTLGTSILEVNGDQVHIHATNALSNVNGISLNTPSGGSFVAIETPQVYIAEPPGGGGTRLQVAGNIITQPGNVLVSGYVSASGNITGNYIFGNGSQLTGITANYSNANVANYLPTFSGNVGAGNIVMTNNTGVIYTNNITGLTGQPVVITADGTEDIHLDADSIRIGDNNIDATLTTKGTGDLILRTNEGSAVEGNIRIYDGANGNIDISPNGSGTINLNAVVTATGNVSAPYFIGNGSQLTGLPSGNTSNSFSTVIANGTSLTANTATSTLTIVAGTNITITANATSNTITINSTATGGGDSLSPFLLMGA